jgi:hypothetical protein
MNTPSTSRSVWAPMMRLTTWNVKTGHENLAMDLNNAASALRGETSRIPPSTRAAAIALRTAPSRPTSEVAASNTSGPWRVHSTAAVTQILHATTSTVVRAVTVYFWKPCSTTIAVLSGHAMREEAAATSRRFLRRRAPSGVTLKTTPALRPSPKTVAPATSPTTE